MFCLRVSARALSVIEEVSAKTAKATILDHPSQSLKIIYFPATPKWSKESCNVANTLLL